MKAPLTRQLTGLILALGLLLNLIAPSIVTLWQPVPASVVNQSRTAQQSKQSSTQSAHPDSMAQGKERMSEAYGKLPISFEVNQGQTDESVRFLARGSGYGLFLTPTEAVLSLRESPAPARTATPHQRAATQTPARGAVLRMKLVESNPAPVVAGLEQLPGGSNYFIGSDPEKWRTGTPGYAKVKYEEVYPGVDLVYYGNQQQLEYDFVLAPGAHADQIKLRFAGAERMRLDESGALVLDTAGGQVRQHQPVAYQTTADGSREIVASRFVLDERRSQVGFEVASYDASRPLVIDPAVSLVYGARFGGSNSDSATDIAVDAGGNAYVTGHTFSLDFPTTAGALKTTGDSVYNDIFVSKLSADGTQLLYSSYIGGDQPDSVTGIALDSSSNIYLSGYTGSTDFPTTAGAYQATFNGPMKAFVLKLNPSLTGAAQLAYSTFLGGSFRNYAMDIAVDGAGRVYVSGETESTDFPTRNAFQPNYTYSTSFHPDAFFALINPAGAGDSDLLYSTYFGGNAYDSGPRVAIDADGNAYVGGYTHSTNTPTTPGAFQPTRASGASGTNIFIAKFDPAAAGASSLLYSTYFGGSGSDGLSDLKLDAAGNVYVTGAAFSTDFPVTPNAIQSVNKGAAISGAVKTDAFVAKLNLAGTGANDLLYSTFLGGGDSTDGGSAVATDSAGNIYVLGSTSSPDFPVSTCGAQGAYRGVPFIAKLDPAASGAAGLLYSSTFSGSTGPDNGTSMIVDANGYAYVAGGAFSIDFPETPGAYHSATTGSNQPFALKFEQLTCTPSPTPTPTPEPTPTPTPEPTATPTPTPTPGCETQNTITMLPPHCSAGLLQTPTLTGGLFEKTVDTRGSHSFHAMMSKEVMLGDGAIEFHLTQGGTAYVGLTETEPWCGYDSVDYLFHVDANYNGYPGGSGIYLIRENDSPGTSVNAGGFSNNQPPPVFRIERHGDTVTYFVNNGVYAVSNKHSTAPLHLYVLLYAPNTQVEVTQFTAAGGLKVRGNVPQLQNVTWQNPINVTIDGNGITKTSGASEGYDAGASSVQQITGDNSFYRFRPSRTEDNMLVALAANDPNASFPASQIALYFSYGSLYSWVTGLGGGLGTFDSTSEFELAVDDGAVRYYRRDPATGARTLITGHGNKVKFPFLFDTSLRNMTAGVRDVVFGQYPYVSPCEPEPTPTPTPTPTPDPTPEPTPDEANMAVFGTVDRRLVPTGEQVTYMVFVANNGPAPASNVTLAGQMPTGVTIASIANNNGDGSCTSAPDGASFNCSFPTAAYLETKIINVTANVAGAPYTKLNTTLTVDSATPDPVAINDSNVVVFFIAGAPVPTPTPATGANPLIAYESRRDGNSEIYTRRADGTGQANLTNSPQDDPSQHNEFEWSPDGTRIAFTRLVNEGDNNSEVFVMNADGSGLIQLSFTPNEHDGTPAWSPDGTRVVFTGRSNLDSTSAVYVAYANGGGLTRISNGPNDMDGAPTTAWSPDGQRIVFSRGHLTEPGQNPVISSDIYVVNADGTGLVQLSGVADMIDSQQAWSPDGTQIAFLRNSANMIDVEYGPADLYVMNADGSNLRSLTNTPEDENDFSWSPDSTRIAYSRGNQGVSLLNVINVGTGAIIGIDTSSNRASTPRWSPDGSKLTYSRVLTVQNYNAATVYIANADGTNHLTVGADAEYNQDPDWSPDGTRIAFYSRRNGGGIDIINADGTGRVDLTNDPAYYADPKWRPIEPPPPPPAADMYVYASASQQYIASGGQVTYTVAVVNGGPEPAADVTLAGQLPAGVTLSSIVNDGDGSCTGAPGSASFNCSFPAAAANETKTIEVHATATGTSYDLLTATFTVASASPADPNTDNNVGSAQFYIASPPLPSPSPGPANEAELAYGRFDEATFQTDIFKQRADGAGRQNLTNHQLEDNNFIWSPNGSKLAFLRYDFANLTVALGVVNADGSNLTLLTSVPGEYIDSYAWSPDSSRLTFSARAYSSENVTTSEVYTINADGTARIGISGADGYNTEPQWSPDGTRISFLRAHYSENAAPTNDIYVSNADGSNPVQISHADGERDFGAVWSPDGTRLAFTRYFPNNTNDVYTVRSDGTDVRRLTNDNITHSFAPQWSPNGSKLSFSTNNTGGALIETMNADGTNRTVVYNPPQGGMYYAAGGEKWSPDSTKLAFHYVVGEAQGGNVCVVGADGTGLNCFGNDLEYNVNPDWSPDSTRLAFTSNRNGVRSIDLIKADGTNRVELTRDDVFGPKWRPAPIAPPANTPAGTNVAVTDNGVQLTFSNVTQAGQTTVTPIDPNSLSGIPGEYVINANSLAFEITTTATYTGPITIGFQVPGINNPVTFSTLRVLHGEPPPVPNFIDRTILAPDSPTHTFSTRTIYARVTSLSPFVIVERASDTTPPSTTATLSAQPNAAGWHKANVNVTLTATDNGGGSGVQSITYSASGAQTIAQTTVNGSTATIPVTTEGTTTITYQAKDVSGNVESAKTITVKLDKTAPAITVVSPAAQDYIVGQSVTASFSCTDAASGSATCTGTSANGAALSTASVGAKVFTVNATDVAGNSASKTVNYTVAYGVKSLHDPTKVNKSGSTVQLELQLVNIAGLNLSSAGVPVTAISISRVSSSTNGPIVEYDGGDPDANFTYQNGQGSYRFKLKTKDYPVGTYLVYFRAGNDPVIHTVQFQLR